MPWCMMRMSPYIVLSYRRKENQDDARGAGVGSGGGSGVGCWMLDVGCWMLDVAQTREGSSRVFNVLSLWL